MHECGVTSHFDTQALNEVLFVQPVTRASPVCHVQYGLPPPCPLGLQGVSDMLQQLWAPEDGSPPTAYCTQTLPWPKAPPSSAVSGTQGCGLFFFCLPNER